jgi:hypothetical protein
MIPVSMGAGETDNGNNFERQTFHERAGETIPACLWAKAFYPSQMEAGKLHHSALHDPAYKWQRILYRCWQTGSPTTMRPTKLPCQKPTAP